MKCGREDFVRPAIPRLKGKKQSGSFQKGGEGGPGRVKGKGPTRN